MFFICLGVSFTLPYCRQDLRGNLYFNMIQQLKVRNVWIRKGEEGKIRTGKKRLSVMNSVRRMNACTVEC